MSTISDVTTEVRIVAIECGICGVQFGIGQRFHEHLVESKSFADLQRHMQGQHPGYTVEG